jgi:protein-tyrosine-phosphatase
MHLSDADLRQRADADRADKSIRRSSWRRPPDRALADSIGLLSLVERVPPERLVMPLRDPGKPCEDWVLDDPAGQDINHVRPIRDEIRRRVEQLISELQPVSSRN